MIGIRTLVLASNYMPISIFPLHTIPVEDAVTRVFNDTCHVVCDHDRVIKSRTVDMKWPSIIARNDGKYIGNDVKLRRDSLYYRDHGRCQYCEQPLTINQVTFDHVIPQRRGGKFEWENLVAACAKCNMAKSDALPVGRWTPKIKPFKPTYHQLLSQRRKFPIIVQDQRWVEFIGGWESDVIVQPS